MFRPQYGPFYIYWISISRFVVCVPIVRIALTPFDRDLITMNSEAKKTPKQDGTSYAIDFVKARIRMLEAKQSLTAGREKTTSC